MLKNESFTSLQDVEMIWIIVTCALVILAAVHKHRRVSTAHLGHKFIGYTVRKYFKAEKKLLVGSVVRYMPPDDDEHGYDWWIKYEDGEMETMNLDELVRYIQG
jgi:hypothetical protein